MTWQPKPRAGADSGGRAETWPGLAKGWTKGQEEGGTIQVINSGSLSKEGHFRQPPSLSIVPSAGKAPADLSSAHLLEKLAFNFALLLILLLLWTWRGWILSCF